MLVSLFTDASWCHRTKVGGWGAWAKSERGKFSTGAAFKDEAPNSTVAEMWAVINGIQATMNQPLFEVGDKILVQTDCEGIVYLMATRRPPEAHKNRYKKLLTRLDELAHKGNSVFIPKHVKGHTSGKEPRLWVNIFCDKIARKHMELARKAKADA